MIYPKRPAQTPEEYGQELERTLGEMHALSKLPGWVRFKTHLEMERQGAFNRMTTSKTVDERAMASTEYTTLVRVIEGPERVMKMLSETLAAKP